MDQIILSISTAFLFFNFAGYIYILRIMSWLRPAPKIHALPVKKHLEIATLVASYQEKDNIEKKLLNLDSLSYPIKRKVYLLDGGSTDGTVQMAEKIKPLLKNIDLEIHIASKGKIPQINEGLKLIKQADLIAITDCDALIENKNAYELLNSLFLTHTDLGVVGGWTIPSPQTALDSEIAYWDKENRLRYLETLCFSSSIVIAPFYCMRKDILNEFPQDCIADDVFASFHSHLQKKRVVYTPLIDVLEMRQAHSYSSLFWQKLRKGNAYLHEVLRSVSHFATAGKRGRFFLFFKLFQFLVLPWASLLYLAGLALCFHHSHIQSVLISILFIIFSTLIASAMVFSPPGKSRGGFKLSTLKPTLINFSLMNIVLIMNVAMYPFWRQSSSYRKVNT